MSGTTTDHDACPADLLYTCKCRPGFAVDPNNRSKCIQQVSAIRLAFPSIGHDRQPHGIHQMTNTELAVSGQGLHSLLGLQSALLLGKSPVDAILGCILDRLLNKQQAGMMSPAPHRFALCGRTRSCNGWG